MCLAKPSLKTDHLPPGRRWQWIATPALRWLTEGVVLALVCFSPWPFASVKPEHVFLLETGVAILTILWGIRMLREKELPWRKSPVIGCLAVLVLLAVWQMVPLPRSILGTIAPTTARLYQRLLPARPEVLPHGEHRDDPIPPAGSTLSLYPAATRYELARLLTLFLLFAAVANLPDPTAALRRLSLAALLNGSALALFGLVQFFSSDNHSVFWTVPTAGQVFGPFVNRNHFAFYMNLCIFLSVGLLLARFAERDRTGKAPAQGFQPRPGGGSGRRLLHHRSARGLTIEAETMGILFALALMVSSVVVCLSRGGLLALAGGSILGVALRLWRTGWSMRERIFLLVPAIVLAMVTWFGFDQVAARLETLRGAEVVKDERVTFWSHALMQARDYPLWGTGFGTYQFVERLYRGDAGNANMLVEHAHNDYLEVLVEAGVPGLLATVLALILLLWIGLRVVRRDSGRPADGLALGALLGVVAIAIHSVTDFSLHIPADAVFATVVCALLVASGHGRAEDREEEAVALRGRGQRAAGVGRLARVLGAFLVIGLGLWVTQEGWKNNSVSILAPHCFPRG